MSMIYQKFKKLAQNYRFNRFIPGLLIVVFGILMVIAVKNDSVTSDETAHIPAGWTYARYGRLQLNNEHPPLMKLLSGIFLLPFRLNFPPDFDPDSFSWEQWSFGEAFLQKSGNDMDLILFWGRLPAVLMSIGLLIIVYFWAKKLAGRRLAGIIALILAMFSPIILTHGRLANTDTPLTFFYTSTFFALWWFLDKPSLARSAVLGLAAGGTLAVKFSAPVIIPFIVLLAVLKFMMAKRPYPILKAIGLLLVSALVGISVLWLSYVISQRQEIFSSQSFELGSYLNGITVQRPISKLFLLPLDRYIEGFKVVYYHSQDGHPAFLNGQYKIEGWWYYFPYSFLLKTPLVNLLLFGLALITLWWGAKKQSFGWLMTLVPLFGFLGVSLFNHINIGVRHIMPIYPLVFVTAAVGTFWLIKFRSWRWILLALLIFYAWDSLSHYPSYMAYFNQLIGSNHNHYKYLADSNTSWSQDDRRMADYLKSQGIARVYMPQPSHSLKYYGIKVLDLPRDFQPAPGSYIVLSANDKSLPPQGGSTLDWLINYSQPIYHIGYSIYLYKI